MSSLPVTAPALTVAQLRALHGASIRARLDWDALHEAPVHLEVRSGTAALGRLRTVWYADAAGNPSSWHDPACRQLTVSEAAAVDWPGQRGADLARLSDSLRRERRGREPLVLTLPVYAAGTVRLLLDATHRAVAAHRLGVDVRMLLLAVHGPADPELLPDLARL